MNKNKTILSAVINFLIVVLTIIAILIDWHNVYINIITGVDPTPFINKLKYFTIQSNLVLAIAALTFFIFDLLLLTSVKKKVPKWMHIIKLCATTGTTITMLVVICVLTPGILVGLSNIPIKFLYGGASSIWHIVNPVLAILTFLLFETNTETELVYCTCGIIHTELYSFFYVLDAYLMFLPTYNDMSHDWYSFVRLVGDKWIIPLVLAFAGFAFLITWLLWLGNKKINILSNSASL